jgi:transcriptional regulator with XRE-family HTH domain
MADRARLHAVPDLPSRRREPLWREVLGQRLRTLRQEHGEKLTDTAGRAGISPQYLSEVERGRKEPSSEMIAALAGALGTTLIDLTEQVAGDLRRWQAVAVPQRAATPQRAARPQRSAATPQACLSLAA